MVDSPATPCGALAEAVLAAQRATQELDKSNYDELKVLVRPPHAVQMTCDALKILLDKDGIEAGRDADGMSFGSSTTILLVGWPFQTQKLIQKVLVERGACWERVERLCAMRDENVDTWNTGKLGFPAAEKVAAWLFAVLDFLKLAKTEGKELKIPYEGK